MRTRYKVTQQAKDVWGITLPDGPIGIDLNAVHARKDKIVKGLTDGIGLLFKKNKVEWVKGSARLLGKGQIEVTAEGQPAQTLDARRKSSSRPVRRRAACRGSPSTGSASSRATKRST